MDLQTGKQLEGEGLTHYQKQKTVVQRYFDWTSVNEGKSLFLEYRYVVLHNVVYEIFDTVKGVKGFLLIIETDRTGLTDLTRLTDLTHILGYQNA